MRIGVEQFPGEFPEELVRTIEVRTNDLAIDGDDDANRVLVGEHSRQDRFDVVLAFRPQWLVLDDRAVGARERQTLRRSGRVFRDNRFLKRDSVPDLLLASSAAPLARASFAEKA